MPREYDTLSMQGEYHTLSVPCLEYHTLSASCHCNAKSMILSGHTESITLSTRWEYKSQRRLGVILSVCADALSTCPEQRWEYDTLSMRWEYDTLSMFNGSTDPCWPQVQFSQAWRAAKKSSQFYWPAGDELLQAWIATGNGLQRDKNLVQFWVEIETSWKNKWTIYFVTKIPGTFHELSRNYFSVVTQFVVR